MKDSLTMLTMAEYVDALCGNISVLADEGETITAAEGAKVVNRLTLEYTEISDPVRARSTVSDCESGNKDKMLRAMLITCKRLVAFGAYDDVRRILTDYGLPAMDFDAERVNIELDRRLKMVEATIARDLSTKKKDDGAEVIHGPNEMRRQFDMQTASLMTYFKFQIDLNTIKASQYAYMVAQCEREIKAKLAALKR